MGHPLDQSVTLCFWSHDKRLLTRELLKDPPSLSNGYRMPALPLPDPEHGRWFGSLGALSQVVDAASELSRL